MDVQRLMAAMLHSSITVQQALDSPLVATTKAMQKCKRTECPNWFETGSGRQYCKDPECLWQRGLIAAREKNARRKARQGAA